MTDRQTDRQTDGQTEGHSMCHASIESPGKNSSRARRSVFTRPEISGTVPVTFQLLPTLLLCKQLIHSNSHGNPTRPAEIPMTCSPLSHASVDIAHKNRHRRYNTIQYNIKTCNAPYVTRMLIVGAGMTRD